MRPLGKPRLALAGPAKADVIFGGRPRHELEFLPAALEVVETPAPPLARVIALVLVTLLTIILAWAMLGKVDIVSTASGRLVPAGGGKVVQPLETGLVTAIRVKDGQFVRKGQVLIELEPTESRSEQERLAGELAATRLDVARLRTVALGEPFKPPAGADAAAAAIAGRQARAEIEDSLAKVQGLAAQAQQHRAELQTAAAEVDRLGAMAPLTRERSAAFETLAKHGYGARLQLLDAQEKEQDTTRSLEVQRRRMPEIQAAITAAEQQRAQAVADALKTDLAALAEAQTKAASLADELKKAQARLDDRTLTAPVDGTVQELAIHTVGGVVAPGQTLMRIAPAAGGLEIEAQLANKDIGFVRANMPAEVKVETFPFTRYGVVRARVLSVSSDAVEEIRAAAPRNGSSASGAVAEPDASPHYVVRLALEKDTLDVDGRMVRLRPGMAVSVELKSGQRRVISFVLSPLSKSTAEAGRER